METTIKTKFKKAIEIHVQPLYKIYDTLEAAKACSIIHQKELQRAEAQRDELLSDLNSALDTLKRELGEDRADVRHYRDTIKTINKQNRKDTFKLL